MEESLPSQTYDGGDKDQDLGFTLILAVVIKNIKMNLTVP